VIVPPRPSQHAHFDQWRASRWLHRAYALRDDAEIAKYIHFRDPKVIGPRQTFYDPRLDAARYTLGPNVSNYEQLRLGVGLGVDLQGVDQVRATLKWNGLWDRSFITEQNAPQMIDPITKEPLFTADGKPRMRPDPKQSYKTTQITDHDGLQGDRWLEPRQRWFGKDGHLCYWDVRYTGPGSVPNPAGGLWRNADPPSVIGGDEVAVYDADGKLLRHYGSDALGPVQAEFTSEPNQWNAFVADILLRRGDPYAEFSLWLCDEDTAPVCLHLKQRVLLLKRDGTVNGAIGELHLEMNTSSVRVGGPMWGAWQDVLVMRDLPDEAFAEFLQGVQPTPARLDTSMPSTRQRILSTKW
jgi:hypothetical protein